MDSLTISSCEDDATLTFCALEGDYCRAELKSIYLSAQVNVTSLDRVHFHRLIEYFESMQKDWRGWNGVREWSSLEREFSLSATSDGLGHVAVQVSFRPIYGWWSADATLVLDVSKIDRLPQQLRKFFDEDGA